MKIFLKKRFSSEKKRIILRKFDAFLGIGCSFLLTACNSLFYHPDAMDWTLPQKVHTAFDEHRIPVGSHGETIHAWHFKTHEPKKGTIVHFHGNAQNMSAHIFFVSWFLQVGFDLITFDYRGYGKSDGHPSRENTIEDGEAILKWIGLKENQNNIFVVGQSLGGAIAAVALQKAQQPNISGAIFESSFVSYRDLVQKKLSSFFLTWPLQWPLSFLVTNSLSPQLFILNLKFPTLVIHGTRDHVVPFSEGLALAEHLKKSKSSSVSFYTVLDGSHTSCFTSQELNPCKQRALDFIETALQNDTSERTRKSR